MARFTRKTMISLEEGGLDVPVNAEEVVVATGPTVQDEELELGELGDAVDEGEEVVETLDEGAIAVERIRITIEEAIQDANGDPDGGMSDGMAAMADVAVANVSDELGLGLDEEAAPEVIASTEAFRAPQGRLAASQVSLEGIIETLKRIWQAIKNAIFRAWEAVKSFFAKLWGGVKKIKERAVALKAKAATIKEDKAGKIKVTGANKLSFGTGFSGATIKAGLTATHGVGQAVFGVYTDNTAALYKAMAAEAAKEAAKAGTDAAPTEGSIPDPEAGITALCGKAISGNMEFVRDAKSALKAGELAHSMGDDKLKDRPFAGSAIVGLMGKINAPILTHAAGKPKAADEGSEIDALSKGDVVGILDQVIAIATLIEGKKSAVEKLNAAAADFRKGVDGALTKIDKNMAVKSSARVYLQLIMRCGGRPWNRPLSQYSSHTFGVLRSALSLAERCIGHHGAVEAKKD